MSETLKNGVIRITPEKLREAMLTMRQYGWRAIHVGGDKALDLGLDAYEAVDRPRHTSPQAAGSESGYSRTGVRTFRDGEI